jgi:hypothetical protein
VKAAAVLKSEPVTERAEIFALLREELARFSPPLDARTGGIAGKDDYQLWSRKPVERNGRAYDETYFAGAIVQKSYVGFYYMPVYAEPELSQVFAPELLALLKGKSCFHVKRLDDRLLAQVRAALDTGFELYRRRGWID